MASFGSIHDLAEVEVRVRRTLQTAQHEIHCAHSWMRDEAPLNLQDQQKVVEMLLRASEAIKRVIGD